MLAPKPTLRGVPPGEPLQRWLMPSPACRPVLRRHFFSPATLMRQAAATIADLRSDRPMLEKMCAAKGGPREQPATRLRRFILTARGLNEIVPAPISSTTGTGLFRACGFEDCAAAVQVTVVSTAVDGQMIIDGGSKRSLRRLLGAETSFGHVLMRPRGHIHQDERARIRRHPGNRPQSLIGERVRVIPNHVCPW